jgi:MFS family permease
MSLAATAAQPAERSLSRAGLTVMAVGSLDLGLEQSLILPALPALARHYDASLVATSWLAIGFMVSSVVAIPLLARFGDIFGRRRLLLVALGAFGVGGVICALADSIGVVIAGRIVQGCGAAAGALMLGLLRDAERPEHLTRSLGIVIGGVSVGGAIGAILSGVLVDHISPQAIFWFLAVLSLVLMAGALAFIPESPVRKRVPIDALGAAFLGSGLAALLLAISKGNSWDWTAAAVLGLFAASAVLLAAFALTESRVRQPLVDLAFVAKRPFVNANVCAFAAGYSIFVVLIVVPQIAAMPEPSGYGFGYSTTKTGLLLLPMAVVAMFFSWVAGHVVDQVGPRALMAGGSAVGIVAYVFGALAHDSAGQIVILTALVGVTFGVAFPAIAAVVIRGPSEDKTSIALGVNSVIRTTATATAIAATAALITGAGLVGPFPAEDGFTRALVMGAIACAFGLAASALLPGRSRASA